MLKLQNQIILRDYQKAAYAELFAAISNSEKRIMVNAPCSWGKCLGKDTPILMFDGSIKLVQDIRVGDQLMGDDSLPRTVISLARGRETMYRVIPNSKGFMTWTCNKGHILSLVYNGRSYPKSGWINGQKYDISVLDYLALPKHIRLSMLCYKVGVDFPVIDVRLNPYILGVWLGDGTQLRPSISTIQPEVIREIESFAALLGMRLTSYEKRGDHQSRTYRITNGKGQPNHFLDMLRSYGLTDEKRIPKAYLNNSREVRLEVLAGLLDTDGYNHGNSFEIVQKTEPLAQDIVFLCRSLGFYTRISEKTVKGVTYYRIHIGGNLSEIPNRVERKRCTNAKRDCTRKSFRLEKLDIDDYYGFTIDGNHRFLLGDFTVAHNTAFISQVILSLKNEGKKIIFAVPALSLVEQAKRDFEKAGITCGIIAGGQKPDYGWRVQIACIHTLTRRQEMDFHPDVIILDECHETAFHGWVRREIPLLLDGKEVLDASILKPYFDALGLPVSSSYKTVQSAYKSIQEPGPVQKTAYQYLRKYQGVLSESKTPNERLIIGLTATPWRLKKSESMGDVFSYQIKRETPREMQEMGAIVPCVYYRPKSANLEGVKTGSDGDFRQDDLSHACSDPEVIENVVAFYKGLCPDKKFICFAVGLNHASKLVTEFQRQGIHAVLISGEMPDKERRELFSQVRDKSNPLMGLVSVGCLSVGFSVNEIECVIHCRPTKSQSLYIQGIGRGQRKCEGKEICIVIDQAHNTKRFPLIEDVIYPDLGQENRFEMGESPTRECPECHRVQAAHNDVCVECGHIFFKPKKEKAKPAKEMEIVVSSRDRPVYNDYQKFIRQAMERNYAPAWARMQCFQLHGRYPRKEWALGAMPPQREQQMSYWNYLQTVANKKKVEQSMQIDYGDKGRQTDYGIEWMQSHFKAVFGIEFAHKIANRPDVTLLDLLSDDIEF